VVFAFSLVLHPIPASAEFKPGKYIEPGPVSNWFARHVRNGMVKRLDLTEIQLAQINEGIDPHRERLMQEIEVVKDARMRLFQTIRTEPYDAALVGLTFEELRASELTLLVHGGEIYQDVWGVLSAEQKAEADEIVAELVTATELRFSDFRESFLAGELLGQSTR
jgi:Spy/CpxP family protein refolding chaperone